MHPSDAKVSWNPRRAICTAAFLTLISCNLPACAGTVLELGPKNAGTVRDRYGERHPGLWGHGISISGIGDGSQTVSMLSGQLNFSDLNFSSSKNDKKSWGAGGSLSIRGCADLNHDSQCDKGDVRGTLLKASFLNAELIEHNGKELLKAEIVEQLNPKLALLMHLPATHTAELELTLAQLHEGRWWSRDGVRGVILADCDPVRTVSEPSSIWILGAILMCASAFRFRKTLAFSRFPR
jgi:hypothetical protein